MTTPKLTDIDQIMGELRDIKGFFDGLKVYVETGRVEITAQKSTDFS